jgi:hypothetical protein
MSKFDNELEKITSMDGNVATTKKGDKVNVDPVGIPCLRYKKTIVPLKGAVQRESLKKDIIVRAPEQAEYYWAGEESISEIVSKIGDNGKRISHLHFPVIYYKKDN